MKIKIADIKAMTDDDHWHDMDKILRDRWIDNAKWAKANDDSPYPTAQTNDAKKSLDEHSATRVHPMVNRHKINEALGVVNGRAARYTYTCCSELMELVIIAENKLAKHNVPKKLRRGTVIHATSGVPTSNAYTKHGRTAAATYVKLERSAGVWYVTDVQRDDRSTGPGGKEKFAMSLTDDIANAVIQNALSDFN